MMSATPLLYGYHASGITRGESWATWCLAIALVILSHAGVWLAYTSWQAGQGSRQPLPSVQITLITAQAPPAAQPSPPPQRPSTPKSPSVSAAKPITPSPAAAVTEEPVAGEQSTARTPSMVQEEYSQPLYNAAYLNNPPPVYPLVARRRGIEGTVVVRAQILSDGQCRQADLSKSSGHVMLDKAAVAAVKSWRFIPARRGAQTITAWVEVPITFRLTKQNEPTQTL